MKDENEFAISLDVVDEALLGAKAKENGITPEEQAQKIISAALDHVALATMNPCETETPNQALTGPQFAKSRTKH